MDLMERMQNFCTHERCAYCPFMVNVSLSDGSDYSYAQCYFKWHEAPSTWDIQYIRDQLIEAQFHFNDEEDCRL